MAVDPELAREFPWLKIDPAPILGESRPRSIQAVLEKRGLWLNLFTDWIEAKHGDHTAGLRHLVTSSSDAKRYAERYSSGYKEFYDVAGRMKDVARKDLPAARERYPWAPANARDLLGAARPKSFDDLVEEGPSGPWYPVYRSWLTYRQPFEQADTWFDWLGRQESESAAWTQSLDGLMTGFVDEIELLKRALHDRESTGDAARRRFRQAGEAVGEVAAKVDAKVEQIANTQIGIDAAGEFERGMRSSRSATTQQPGGQQGMQSRRQRVAAMKAQQGGQQGQGGTGQQGQGGAGQQGGAGKAPTPPPRQTDPVATARASLNRQVALAEAMVPLAAEVATIANQLGHKFAAVGGACAAEAESLYAYRQLVSDAQRTLLVEANQAKTTGAAAMTTAGVFDALRALRYAAFVVAWDVDLGYVSECGRWPHYRLQMVLGAVADSGVVPAFEPAGQVGMVLARGSYDLYEKASAMLDIAKQLIDMGTPGYDGEDGSQPWGVHEAVGAANEAAALFSYGQSLAGQQPAEEVDEQARDEALQNSFGVTHEQLVGAVAALL